MSNVPGTNSPPLKDSKVLGDSGQSKSIPDSEQRGDQFGNNATENVESGNADLGNAAKAAQETAEQYNSKTNLGLPPASN
ncbi:MAG: hypothetical protein CYPHOPRED_005035 [Cyphobasidiales sp. Tagirdzhanova-0007]|nr:MAG: hypothetical protein CYPHOPRED_005035 [Cyphobasidiales sp. Tagirdzhanova-0007]